MTTAKLPSKQKVTTAKVVSAIEKRYPTKKQVEQATNTALKQYSKAIKNLANR